jgi:hypothetical protein
MKLKLLLVFFFIGAISAFTQVAPDKYFVKFTDKNNSPYSIDNPSEYLSQRAIDRRVKQGIPIDISDLPVNPSYLEGVAGTGATILNPTKWLNGATIYTDDPAVLDAIGALPYVSNVLSPGKEANNPEEVVPVFEKPFFKNEIYGQTAVSAGLKSGSSVYFNYGQSYNQISMLKGDQLHDMGYRGKGMVIAVLDAGYTNAHTLDVFDTLWANDQILGSRDFVSGGSVTYDKHPHGSMVLSTMGGNYPGELIGTAPEASFWLLRSEDGGSEYIIEEYNWVSAAEFADSVGADIINSSLGYSEFNNTAQNHTYADLDGDTAPVTIGADFAASKGILVVNSLGNAGDDPWYYLIAPSDGDSVVGVGAVDGQGNHASFSSYGPSSDGRVKPNLATQGSGVWVVDPSHDSFTFSGGTSFSSPILAGMAACLWQTLPGQNNMQVLQALQQSASQYNNPDDTLGYGIPDMIVAKNILSVFEPPKAKAEPLKLFPNPFSEYITLELTGHKASSTNITVNDLSGRLVYSRIINGQKNDRISITELNYLPEGIYFIKVIMDEKVLLGKAIKTK